MKYVCSGLNGFIGSNIKRMLDDKHTVVGISQQLLYAPDDLKTFFEEENPDYIVHLASYGNHSNQQDVALTIFSNIIGTYNMLSASKDINYKKFIHVGSSSEYGKKNFPMRETDMPETDTFYGASKVGATYIARAFAVKKPVVIVRPFSVYGENEADFRFIPTAIKHLIKGTEMPLATAPVHDWIYVEDFISGMFLAAEKAENGEIVNIGTGRERSNKEIIEVLENISGKKLSYTESEGSKKPHDNLYWSADMTKLISWGFITKFPLGLGLMKTYEFYKDKYAE